MKCEALDVEFKQRPPASSHNERWKIKFEPQHDKTNNMAVRQAKISDQPGHPPSLISLCCPHEETLGPYLPIECTSKTDQTGRMPRLIWVFAGCTLILLVLSCRGFYFSYFNFVFQISSIIYQFLVLSLQNTWRSCHEPLSSAITLNNRQHDDVNRILHQPIKLFIYRRCCLAQRHMINWPSSVHEASWSRKVHVREVGVKCKYFKINIGMQGDYLRSVVEHTIANKKWCHRCVAIVTGGFRH